MANLVTLVLGLILVAAVLSRLWRWRLPQPLPDIPYNKDSASRFDGDLPYLATQKHRREWIVNLPGSFDSPVAQLLLPMSKPAVVVSDYRTVSDIITKRLKDFDRGPRNSYTMGWVAPSLQLVLNTSDPAFRAHRELLRDLMTPSFLNQIAAPRIYDNINALVNLWKLKADKAAGHPFDASGDLSGFTLDSIRAVAFGVDDSNRTLLREIQNLESHALPSPQGGVDCPVDFPKAEMGPETNALLDMAEVCAMGMKSPFPWVTHTLALLTPKHGKAWLARKAMIDKQTNLSLKKLSARGECARENALDQVLWREMNVAKKHEKKPDFYSSVIRDEMLGFLLGGHDTTWTTLSWWIKFMMVYPDVQSRLREQIRQAYPRAVEEERCPTIQEVQSTSVPYLDAVIEETLRMGTIFPILTRQAMRDTEILGFPIPKGTNIVISMTGPGVKEPALESAKTLRDGKPNLSLAPNWDEQDIGDFKPQRWLKTDASTGREIFDPKAGPMLTFSAGPRMCWGRKLAYVQLKATATLLLWNFAFEEIGGDLGGLEKAERFTDAPKDIYVKLRDI